ncbi:glycosyltransferase family 4 protein [Acidipropionibacterium timonense]|uniref:glycosyltransferase family 4 protein n=1 Tax=Acidipropionibacterium timonense TaxID=2161818 RepID=UPI001030D8F8|nr:glycosyltransferase family 4 protein [Acidipropionibacterium timonense]
MASRARICHLSTVHNPRDNRVFRKECCSLARAGADVWFIGAQDGEEIVEGVHVVGVGKATNRVDRLTRRQALAWRALDRISPDVVHVHDPELIPMVMAWKTLRHRAAVYDAHEDLVGQVEAKEYLPDAVKPIARLVAKGIIGLADHGFDGIVASTSTVLGFYRNPNRAVVRNYPMLSDFPGVVGGDKQDGQVAYVGMLSAGRQVDRMFEMIDRTPGARLVIAGLPDPEVKHFFDEVDEHPGITWLGRVPGEQVPDILAKSWLGVAFFKPIKNYQKALPTKLFEYMAAGIPFISTDLPYLVELFGSRDCGVFVDTSVDSSAAASALAELLADPERCRRMGANGRRAIEEEMNFEAEADELMRVEKAAVRRPDVDITGA